MELRSLQTFSFPSFVHDAAIIAGLVVALVVALAFINLGLLLPGLLSSLGRYQDDPPGRYVEFGPAAAPLISEPAPRRETSPATSPDPPTMVRPHLWRHASGGGSIELAAPGNGGRR
jgi:hypothetical protein